MELQKAPLKEALQREFILRCKKNPHYSLRSYSHFLEIDQSFLSKILNGSRSITAKTEQKLWPKLKPTVKPVMVKPESPLSFIDLKEDEYEVISSWYHFALLELLKIKKLNHDSSALAQQLGIHTYEAKSALERLFRLGFIKKVNDRWKLVSKNHSWTRSEYTTEARRRMQVELVQKSLTALEQVPFDQRENTSLTVAIDHNRLPEFKVKIQECIKEFSVVLQPDEKKLDAVYQMIISLFPLTPIKKNSEEKK